MAQPFDAYHRWLGISPHEQPAHHYRLLGIPLFEGNPDVIESAADRQMTHLRTFQAGEHGVESQRLLNEVAAARMCLLSPSRKAAYDQVLQQQMSQEEPATLGGVEGIAASIDPLRAGMPASQRVKRPKKERRLIVAGAVMAAAVAGTIAVMVWHSVAHQPPTHGMLAIEWPEGMRHGATLTLNGSPRKVLPLGRLEYRCPAGAVEIVATSPGYAPHTRSVDVLAGGVQTVRLEWKESAAAAAQNAAEGSPQAATKNANLSAESRAKPEGRGQDSASTVEWPQTTSRQPATKEPDKKFPVPSDEVQATIVARIDEAFQVSRAVTVAEKLQLAEDLAAAAEKTQESPEKYVLLRRAAELDLEAGDAEAMLDVVDAIAAEFAVNGLALKEKMLVRFAASATTPARIESLLAAARQLVEQAMAEDRLDVAGHAARQADSACSGVAGARFRPEAAKLLQEVGRLREQRGQIEQAEATLAASPTNPAANLALGRWYCFTKNDWPRGIPYLAKGSDSLLRQLAEQEVAGGQATEAKVALGDGWWDAAAKEDAAGKDPARSRAVWWYAQAWPQATGAARTKIAKRLGQFIAAVSPDERPSEQRVQAARLLAADGQTPREERIAARRLLTAWDPDAPQSSSKPDASAKAPPQSASAPRGPAGKLPLPPGQPIPVNAQNDAALAEAWNTLAHGDALSGRARLEGVAKTDGAEQDLRLAFSLGLVDALLRHDWESAEKRFALCVRLQPDHVASLNNLALVRMRLKSERLALRHWEAILAQGPAPVEVAHNLAHYRQLVRSGRVKLAPSVARLADSLAAKAATTAASGFVPSNTGFLFMRLVTPAGQVVGWQNDRAYEDHWCAVCGGRGEQRCPQPGCVRGQITQVVQRQIGVQPLTKTPISQNVTLRVPCSKCSGRGSIDCPHCEKGKDQALGASRSR